jgi:hypothetical protein
MPLNPLKIGILVRMISKKCSKTARRDLQNGSNPNNSKGFERFYKAKRVFDKVMG